MFTPCFFTGTPMLTTCGHGRHIHTNLDMCELEVIGRTANRDGALPKSDRGAEALGDAPIFSLDRIP
jgi:hypothetical protein